MEYKPNYFTQSYADRTWENYQQLRRSFPLNNNQSEQCRVFEVTQLINSFFGILIVPFEASKPFKDKNNLQNTLDSYRSTLQNMIKADKGAVDDIKSLINVLVSSHRYYNDYQFDNNNTELLPLLFIERLRNALSHGGDTGLRFFPATVPAEEKNSLSCISSVIFVDKCREGSFIVELQIDEMEQLLCLLHRIFSNYPVIKKLKAERYRNNIEELRRIMQG